MGYCNNVLYVKCPLSEIFGSEGDSDFGFFFPILKYFHRLYHIRTSLIQKSEIWNAKIWNTKRCWILDYGCWTSIQCKIQKYKFEKN
jgi:hypothetical protein